LLPNYKFDELLLINERGNVVLKCFGDERTDKLKLVLGVRDEITRPDIAKDEG